MGYDQRFLGPGENTVVLLDRPVQPARRNTSKHFRKLKTTSSALSHRVRSVMLF